MDGRIEAKNWHVLVKTRNGNVSLIKNLTLKEAAEIYARMINWSRLGPGQSMIYYPQDGDIVQCDILGPEGWDGCLKAFAHDWVFPTAFPTCRVFPTCSLCHKTRYD